MPLVDTNAYPIPVAAQTNVFNSVPVTTKVIALTFDDGPWPGYTEQILAILAQNNVKATFFQVGSKLAENPALGRAIRNAGHAIGNHTMNHLQAPADPVGEVQQADNVIQSTYGGPTALFRPPFGNFDNGVVTAAQAKNQAIIIWSVDPQDWAMPGADAIVNTVLSGATPGGIVLLHDGGGDRSQTVAALPRIISGLASQGYRFVTVPELLSLAFGAPPIPKSGDITAPLLSISVPSPFYSYNTLNASGTVSDSESGVGGVKITLKRAGDALFWNGSAWTAAATPLSAQIASGSWNLPLSFLGDGRYSLGVSASDIAGNVANAPVRDFWVDNLAPVTTISTPTNGSSYASLIGASGTTNDNGGGGVSGVLTALMRSDGLWWTGTAWSPNYSELRATLNNGIAWNLALPSLSVGSYTLWARSFDYVGNQGLWARSDFRITSLARQSQSGRATSTSFSGFGNRSRRLKSAFSPIFFAPSSRRTQ